MCSWEQLSLTDIATEPNVNALLLIKTMLRFCNCNTARFSFLKRKIGGYLGQSRCYKRFLLKTLLWKEMISWWFAIALEMFSLNVPVMLHLLKLCSQHHYLVWIQKGCFFLFILQVNIFVYVLRETHVAPRKWRTDLANRANKTLRISLMKWVMNWGLPLFPDIKDLMVSLFLFSLFWLNALRWFIFLICLLFFPTV